MCRDLPEDGAAPAEDREGPLTVGDPGDARGGDFDEAAADYEAVLATRPDDVGALEALADLNFRRRDVARAKELYARLAKLPSQVAAEVWMRRGELAEADAEYDEAVRHYSHALEIDHALAAAHEALARLALRRDDQPALFVALKSILDALPLDEVDRITDLRQRLGDLALRLGSSAAARNYYELVLAQHPDEIDAMTPLADLYAAAGDWDLAADALGRLSYLAATPRERANYFFRQAEVQRTHLGQVDRASQSYLKAYDIDPTHQPTLRRLVAYYFSTLDVKGLREVVDELEAQSASTGLGDVAAEAGLGFALVGDSLRAARYLQAADATGLAAALANLQARDPSEIDHPIEVAVDALTRPRRNAGDAPAPAVPEEELARARDRRLELDAGDLGARLVRARLAEQAKELDRARLHYTVLAFADPSGPAAKHALTLGPAPPPTPAVGERRVDSELAPALAALGPLILGLSPQLHDAEPLPDLRADMAPITNSFGFAGVDMAATDDIDDPAWAEPSFPPRILVRRDLLADEPAVRFGIARALHLLRSGVSLITGRALEDLAAMLSAAATLADPARPLPSPFANAWLEELRALAIVTATLPAEALARAADVNDLDERIDAYLATERLAADLAALRLTGDLAAALRALAHPVPVQQRTMLLATHAELRAFVELVTSAALG